MARLLNTSIIMSEMLGNQYFMARKYDAALAEFEKCAHEGKSNKGIIKKTIICYTQVGKIEKAAELLNKLIDKDLEFILNTDPILDDCPCHELADNLEAKYDQAIKSFDYLLALSVLWLYCDIDKSISYFKKTLEIKSDNKLVISILAKLSNTKKRNIKGINHYPC